MNKAADVRTMVMDAETDNCLLHIKNTFSDLQDKMLDITSKLPVEDQRVIYSYISVAEIFHTIKAVKEFMVRKGLR